MTSAPPFWRAAALGDVPHGFFGRQGGADAMVPDNFNAGIGSDDEPALVADNRRRAAEAIMPGAALVSVYQVHSADCVTVAQPWGNDARPRADALVTDRPGVLLGIVTADCVPVLLADHAAGVVGAAHAGWKGALGGVTDAAVAAMTALGAAPERIIAAIGPCIGAASYEVDDSFIARFCADDADNDRFFRGGRPGHGWFDIAAYVAARLAAAGLRQIVIGGQDTYADGAAYFSYRRACHQGAPGYGRQLSIIGMALA